MPEIRQTRDVAPLMMRADVVPGSLNEEARTVDVVWTTGARVKRYDWFDGPFWEELSTDPAHVRMGRLQSGRAPVLLQHNSYNPSAHQGVVVRAAIKVGEGTATLRFLKDDADADKTWNKIRQGVLTSVSVGYSVHLVEETRGTEGSLPIRKAIDWEPYEISPVSMPADPAAHMRTGTPTNPCEFITRGEAPHEEKKMPEEKKEPAPEQADAARKQEQTDANAEKVRAAERERATAIASMVTRHNLGADFATELIGSARTLDEARTAILDKLAERSDAAGISSHVRIEAGEDQRDKRIRGAAASLFERTGYTDLIVRAKDNKRIGAMFKDVETDGGEFRGMSLVEIARDFLERAGVKTRGMDKMTLVGRALTHRTGGYQTTSDFGTLFETALYKMLLAAYGTIDDTWRSFCGTDTVPDFRTSKRYRNGSFGTLDTLTEHGEFKNKAIPDGSSYGISTETRGNIIALTREAIINDDMGAFADLATRFGRSAGLSIEVAVYALLTPNSGLGATYNGQPFFDAQNSNINTTGSAISVDGLEADTVVMGRQKDPSNNEYLSLRPAVLLVADGLRGTADVINRSEYDTSVSSKFQVPNKVRGLFRQVVGTPRLTGTRRYLFADPSSGATAIKVVFLEGSGEAPFMEQKDGWRMDGTEWKLRMDFKAQFFDPKGAVTNAGQ